jgi:nicotinate-nucleotide adenylyltransferase
MIIGILGGSFDPVHFGHLDIAKHAINELSLDMLIVVPTKLQPFKLNIPHTKGEHRYEMLKLAFEGMDRVEISNYELSKDEISYTINTLYEFKERYKGSDIRFLLGTDAFLKIELWKKAKELLIEFDIIVGSRPGYKEDQLNKQINHLNKTYGTKIYKIANEKLDISSTDIKKRIQQGQPIAKFVPLAVERYINKHALYK